MSISLVTLSLTLTTTPKAIRTKVIVSIAIILYPYSVLEQFKLDKVPRGKVQGSARDKIQISAEYIKPPTNIKQYHRPMLRISLGPSVGCSLIIYLIHQQYP